MAPHPEDPPTADTAEAEQKAPSPVSSPSCQISDQVLSTSYATEQGSLSPEAILRLLRNQVCNDVKCEAPDSIKKDAIAVAKDDLSIYKKCEISVGLANGIEGYVFRQTEPVGNLQNDCSESIDKMIDKIGGVTKECWWVGSHKNQVYQAGFRKLNPAGNTSLHMQNGTTITGFLADAAPPIDMTVEHKGSTTKSTIPIVVGAVMGVILIILSLVIFLIWKRNKRERQRWRAALERRSRRQTNKHGHGHNHTASGRSTTLLGSLTSGNKSWNPVLNAHNQTAALPPCDGESSNECREIREKERIPVNDETIAAGAHDAALARKLQRKYDAAQERSISSPNACDCDGRVQSPQPPGYDAITAGIAGVAMDQVQNRPANRISYFAPSLGPDRFRPSAVAREKEPPLPSPPPAKEGPRSPKSPVTPRHNAEEDIFQDQSRRQLRTPTSWKDASIDPSPHHHPSPPDRPLPERPPVVRLSPVSRDGLHDCGARDFLSTTSSSSSSSPPDRPVAGRSMRGSSPQGWFDALDDFAWDDYMFPEKLLPDRPEMGRPMGRAAIRQPFERVAMTRSADRAPIARPRGWTSADEDALVGVPGEPARGRSREPRAPRRPGPGRPDASPEPRRPEASPESRSSEPSPEPRRSPEASPEPRFWYRHE